MVIKHLDILIYQLDSLSARNKIVMGVFQRNVYKYLNHQRRMKEESGERKHVDNSCGVVGVVFGILSLVFVIVPFAGVILGVIGVIFSYKQKKIMKNKWATAGLWMCSIGIILGAIWSIVYVRGVVEFVEQYQEQLRVLQQNGGGGAPA